MLKHANPQTVSTQRTKSTAKKPSSSSSFDRQFELSNSENQPGEGNKDWTIKGWRQRFADRSLNKGHISPLMNKGLLVGSEEALINVPVVAHRYDSSHQLTDAGPLKADSHSNNLDPFYGVVTGFRGDQVTSSESGSGSIGGHWGKNTLDSNITGINVVNGASGTVGIRIALKDIQHGAPVIVTSGALSGCTMVYAVKNGYFFAYHTGQKPGDKEWKTGRQGVVATYRSHQALSPDSEPMAVGEQNNDLVNIFASYDQGIITYMGKPGVIIDNTAENVGVFNYDEVKLEKPDIRAGYSYALLAKDDKGKVNVKVLSEDVIVPLGNKGKTIKAINSLKKRLL
ncbi:Rho-activating domain of cytotoxic necrotizing factor [Photorhabdus australis subsp. thailandensis]|uniref:Rho-activating domain of cytotoxic necrotizing factor n=1 Tax=Photorhabdus australis subsp. thailandensis TaxID=2805096 RepID=A0A1C0U3L1_9GAMM|nr:cytotoxic necrotizing factor Rho-activating domain-containing protein [Photorhabdus australis]OCQ52481.1 Rho-activating domain of cytotoxic necrotizing factor [Photorhabdus australis subsp. thailandensis]